MTSVNLYRQLARLEAEQMKLLREANRLPTRLRYLAEAVEEVAAEVEAEAAAVPSAKAGGGKLTVMTVNVQNHERGAARLRGKLEEICALHGVDVVCTQEDIYERPLELKDFSLAARCRAERLGDTHLANAVLVRTALPSRPEGAVTLTADAAAQGDDATERCAAVAEVTLPGRQHPVRVASVHLAGGRFEDREYHTDYYQAAKATQLRSLVGSRSGSRRVDLIAGDMNGTAERADALAALNARIRHAAARGQRGPLRSVPPEKAEREKERYVTYATSGARFLLDEAGYRLAYSQREAGATTPYNTTVDWMFVHSESPLRPRPGSTKTVDLITENGGYTDHNAVIHTFAY